MLLYFCVCLSEESPLWKCHFWYYKMIHNRCYFFFFSSVESRALGNSQLNKLLQSCQSPRGLIPLDHCSFLALYSCKDIVMEHKYNNLSGKKIYWIRFYSGYTGCELYSQLPRPKPMFSLLSLHLIPVLSPSAPPSVSSALLGCSDSSVLQLPCVTAPGKACIGVRGKMESIIFDVFHWDLQNKCILVKEGYQD